MLDNETSDNERVSQSSGCSARGKMERCLEKGALLPLFLGNYRDKQGFRMKMQRLSGFRSLRTSRQINFFPIFGNYETRVKKDSHTLLQV